MTSQTPSSFSAAMAAALLAWPAAGWSQSGADAVDASAVHPVPRLAAIEVKGQAMQEAATAYTATAIEREQIQDLHIGETQALFRLSLIHI